MSALEGFIDNPDMWFDFLEKRNLSVHTYKVDIIDYNKCDAEFQKIIMQSKPELISKHSQKILTK